MVYDSLQYQTIAVDQNNELRGAVAFQSIANQLRDGTLPGTPFAAPCFERLSKALFALVSRLDERPSEIDLAILVRQVLRFHKLQMGGTESRLWVPSGRGWPDAEHWQKVGIESRKQNSGFAVQASPWIPDWLPDAGSEGVDAAAASEERQRQNDLVPGDPFMHRIAQHRSYLTRGQRSAVRAALCTPSGGTLLVCLPTGDGKSYVFQVVASVGYGINHGLQGVTLVVTPTVALALDHQRAAEQMGIAGHRLAYVGGMNNEEHSEIVNRIRNGTQGLCFAAPEAVCGPLRPALMAAAAAGFLHAIVVDEAHLVDAWGANFRSSFQILSGLRTELLNAAPTAERPRTLLLSATLTDATVETLQKLFGGYSLDETAFQLVSAAQLRPEIEYWVSKPTNDSDRCRRVMEALTHMPRPAILYVTEVAHAEKWYRNLRDFGFKRVGLMTGKSSSEQRSKVVEDWREQRLDLVVGTSAFGLGIDNPNVRTVVHACVPETIDRFYQEVGRGGRNGRSAASIIVPVRDFAPNSYDDYRTARGLNRRRLLTVEVAHQRWVAMFNQKDRLHEGNSVFRLRVDGRPGLDAGYIDMIGERNTEWNIRTLTLMANAGMIALLGPQSNIRNHQDSGHLEADSDSTEAAVEYEIEQFQRVRVINAMHLDLEVWQKVVEPHRKHMESAYRDNLNRMFRFLEGNECAADTLAPTYRLELRPPVGGESCVIPVAAACGGCPACRAQGLKRETEPAQTPKHPWPPTENLLQPAMDLIDNTHRVLIFYGDNMDNRTRRRWTEALAKLAVCGVRNLIALPGAPIKPADVQEKQRDIAIFAADRLPPRDDLPPGPVVVIVPPGHSVTKRLIRPREPSDAHFIFIHRDTEYPDMPGVLLRSRFEGAQIDGLDHLIERVNP